MTSNQLGLSVLLIAGFGAPVAKADLEIGFSCYNSTTPPTQSSPLVPLIVPFSCTPGVSGTVTGTVQASYSPRGFGLGSLVNYNGIDVPTSDSIDAFVSDAVSHDILSITSATLAAGTPIALGFLGSLNGFYIYSTPILIQDDVVSQISVSTSTSTTLLNNQQELQFCNPAAYSPNPCPSGWTASAIGSSTLDLPLVSGTFVTTVGATGLELNAEFEQAIQGIGTFTGDFLDPFTLSDIVVTDPSTGQPLSGITITGASGVTYPVNTSAVPEPSALIVLLTLLTALVSIVAVVEKANELRHAPSILRSHKK